MDLITQYIEQRKYNPVTSAAMYTPQVSPRIAIKNTPPTSIGMEAASDTATVIGAGYIVQKIFQAFMQKCIYPLVQKKHDLDEIKIKDLAVDMLKKHKLVKEDAKFVGDILLDDKVSVGIGKAGQEAYYTHIGNKIVVTKDTALSLFHEIGHAVEENNTKILKFLQRFRGHYQYLAMGLYALGREPSNEEEGKESFLGKCKNFLHKHKLVIPLIAFSPELITEVAASGYGLAFLRKDKPELFKTAFKHYAAAFSTYLAMPVMAIIDDWFSKKAKNQS